MGRQPLTSGERLCWKLGGFTACALTHGQCSGLPLTA